MKLSWPTNTIPFWTKKTEKSLWGKYRKTMWILIVIALITLFYVFINFFTSLGDNNLVPHTETPVSLEDMDQFQTVLAASINSSVEPSGATSILTDGDEFLADLLTHIESAQKSILITNFIWDN